MILDLDDLSDPRLDAYRDVRDAALASRGGRFLAEGRLVVRALLADSRFGCESVLVSPAAHESLRDVLEARAAAGLAVFRLPQDAIDRVAGVHLHRGCLAVGIRGAALDAVELLSGPAPERPLVVLEGVNNHDNVGAVFRNAAAFDARAVFLCGDCVDPLYRKSIRVSMGAALRVPFARVPDVAAAIDLLRTAGYQTLALTPGPDAEDLAQLDPAPVRASGPRPIAILLGAEGPGLSDRALALADRRVRIAISGSVDSLNVATACAIALHRLAPAQPPTCVPAPAPQPRRGSLPSSP